MPDAFYLGLVLGVGAVCLIAGVAGGIAEHVSKGRKAREAEAQETKELPKDPWGDFERKCQPGAIFRGAIGAGGTIKMPLGNHAELTFDAEDGVRCNLPLAYSLTREEVSELGVLLLTLTTSQAEEEEGYG